MRGIWTTDQVQAAEERLLVRTTESVLMRRAAYGVAVQAAELLTTRSGAVAGRSVVLLVGTGNNGGDALWAGAFLRRRGVGVAAVLQNPDRVHSTALAEFHRAGGRLVDSQEAPDRIASADLVVDGIVGISAQGPLRPAAAALLDHVDSPVLSVDLPSGVDPNTGVVDGAAVRAVCTVTFGAEKPVHVLNPERCGDIVLVDIGLSGELGDPDLLQFEVADIAAGWPIPGPTDHKYTQGVTGVAAGSSAYPGAGVLTAAAATMATSGMVRYAGSAADAVSTHSPEVIATGSVFDAERVDAWAVGPGIGTGTEGKEVLEHTLRQDVPICADADAITLIAQHPEVLDARDPETPLVLTPHDGEFRRLTGDGPGVDRVSSARQAARRFDAVVVLKGHHSIVAHPDGRVSVNPARGSWLATAGSGDVLTGMIGALLASGSHPWRAAAMATYVHSWAGEVAARGAPVPSSTVLTAVPEAVRQIRRAGQGHIGSRGDELPTTMR